MIEIDPNNIHDTMRAANVARGIEWSNGAKDGPDFYAVELFGEAGELLNVVKKLERERLGMVGSRATKRDLADELADVVICIDLLAIAFDLPEIKRGPAAPSPASSQLDAATTLGASIGRVMSLVLPARSEAGLLEPLRACLEDAMEKAWALGESFELNLRKAIILKFNKTSEKYGLSTMLSADAQVL